MIKTAPQQAEDAQAAGRTRSRKDIPVQHTWDLTHIFAGDGAWQEAKASLAGNLERIGTFRGRLCESAALLYECLAFHSELELAFSKLFSYSSMKSDEDTRDSLRESMKQEIHQMAVAFQTASAFMEPELVTLTQEDIDGCIAREPRLEVYRFYLEDLQRRKAHQLSEKEEVILARAGMLADGPYTVYSIFSNAELPYPEAELSDGTRVTLDPAGYSRCRQLPERRDRMTVFKSYWDAVGRFRATLGAQLFTQVNRDIFFAGCRHYPDTLRAALDEDNIPAAVYHALIANVNSNFDSFHRYLALKKRLLGVDTLKYQDLYAPAVKDIDLEYSIEEAWDLVTDSLAPLGEEYLSVIRRARQERWVDVYPAPGKRSGAYSNDGGYDIHPYILLNYTGRFSDVSTLTHELGHSMHTWFSNRSQPFVLAEYPIFAAEVASTLNEALLTEHMLSTVTDPGVRLSLLMEYLDGLKGTVFRQTQFAEFEMQIHRTAEAGIPLTGENLTEMYAEILEKYYGHQQGICRIDDHLRVEWAGIPHFYYNFYVYQYATSFTASTALAARVISGEEGAVERVIRFLSAGGSDYPIEVLRQAGVDMTGSAPFTLTMKAMNRIMDEIEEILRRQGR